MTKRDGSKVYGGTIACWYDEWHKALRLPEHVRQIRCIVCANSHAEARRILAAHGIDITRGEWSAMWCETGNAAELAVAQYRHGSVWIAPLDGPRHAERYTKIHGRTT